MAWTRLGWDGRRMARRWEWDDRGGGGRKEAGGDGVTAGGTAAGLASRIGLSVGGTAGWASVTHRVVSGRDGGVGERPVSGGRWQ